MNTYLVEYKDRGIILEVQFEADNILAALGAFYNRYGYREIESIGKLKI